MGEVVAEGQVEVVAAKEEGGDRLKLLLMSYMLRLDNTVRFLWTNWVNGQIENRLTDLCNEMSEKTVRTKGAVKAMKGEAKLEVEYEKNVVSVSSLN